MRTRGNSGGGGHFALGTLSTPSAAGTQTTFQQCTDVTTGETFTPKGVMLSGGGVASGNTYYTYLLCNTDIPIYGRGWKTSQSGAYSSTDEATPTAGYNVQPTTNGFNVETSGGSWAGATYKYVAWD